MACLSLLMNTLLWMGIDCADEPSLVDFSVNKLGRFALMKNYREYAYFSF